MKRAFRIILAAVSCMVCVLIVIGAAFFQEGGFGVSFVGARPGLQVWAIDVEGSRVCVRHFTLVSSPMPFHIVYMCRRNVLGDMIYDDFIEYDAEESFLGFARSTGADKHVPSLFEGLGAPDEYCTAWYIPLWFILPIIALPMVFRAWRVGRSWASPPAPPGFCAKCGYDLRATPLRCPECGAGQSGCPSRGRAAPDRADTARL